MVDKTHLPGSVSSSPRFRTNKKYSAVSLTFKLSSNRGKLSITYKIRILVRRDACWCDPRNLFAWGDEGFKFVKTCPYLYLFVLDRVSSTCRFTLRKLSRNPQATRVKIVCFSAMGTNNGTHLQLRWITLRKGGKTRKSAWEKMHVSPTRIHHRLSTYLPSCLLS